MEQLGEYTFFLYLLKDLQHNRAVGNVAVQYAKKVLGVKRVVAIAGTDEKCTWLKTIGADEAVNYKSTTFIEDLVKATPDKVDL